MYIKWHRARLVLQVHGMTERGDPGIVHLMQLLINAPDSILTIHEQFDTPTKETLPDMAWWKYHIDQDILMKAYNLDKTNNGPSAPGYAAHFGI